MTTDYILARLSDNSLAKKLGLQAETQQRVLAKWQQPHRFYHTTDHAASLFRLISEAELPRAETEILEIAALFHDAVFYPGNSDNEEKSAALFRNSVENFTSESDTIVQIILDTKGHTPRSDISALFCGFDLRVKTHGTPSELLAYERGIFLEFQRWNYLEYKSRRIDFLRNMTAVHPATKNSAWFLEGIIESRRPRIGLYPGTFSPFHTGHLSILEKAENIFDKVIIAVGINPDKDARTPQERLAEVQRILPFHEVIIFSGFLTELIQQHEEYADITVIRGLRNGNDLDYEVNQLRFMEEQYSSVRTMYLVCDKQFEHISSTSIRNLSRINPQFAEKYTPVKYQYFSGTE